MFIYLTGHLDISKKNTVSDVSIFSYQIYEICCKLLLVNRLLGLYSIRNVYLYQNKTVIFMYKAVVVVFFLPFRN